MCVALAWGATPSAAQANPTGGVAIQGQASFSTNGNQLLVTTQNGGGLNHSAINWQSFSIPTGSSTYFQQPHAASTSINRVVTSTPSLVFGTLGSNGNLVLVNQSGITVGAGAVVDTAGFTASALRMSDADALSGRLRFGDASAATGSVSVMGNVLANSGDIFLLGASVDTGSSALVQAPNGSTVLAAGQQIEITGRGLEGIVMRVQAPSDSAVNLGSLKGDAVGVFAATLKHSGLIQATTATLEGGKVVLKASGDAVVEGAAKLVATGTVGGSVDVLGHRVAVMDLASIDVSGTQAGGVVRVGGDYQGQNPDIGNANVTYFGAQASIKADATAQGDGGQVIVWADDTTRAYGRISAKGGTTGGNGGLVETSGKRMLDTANIRVDASAAQGKAGTWLLDPNDVQILPGVGTDSSVTSGAGIWDTTDDNAVVYSDNIANALNAGTSVTIQTGSAGANTQSGNITMSGVTLNVTPVNDTSLTLRASKDVLISDSIISATDGKLHLTLNAHASDDTAGGIVQISNSDISTNGGNVVIGGGLDPKVTPAIGYDGSLMEAYRASGIAIGGSVGSQVAAGGGDITLHGQGSGNSPAIDGIGVEIKRGTLSTTGAGQINITGTGGSAPNANYGVYLYNAELRTENGALSVTGNGGGGSAGIPISGIALAYQSTIEATGTGSIALTGSSQVGYGFKSILGPNTIRTASGNISITGTAGSDETNVGATGVLLDSSVDIPPGGTIVESTQGGSIAINGTGGGDQYGLGVEIGGSSQIRTSGAGTISITGTGSATGTVNDNTGVLVRGIPGFDNSENTIFFRPLIETTGLGSLTVTGTGGAGASYNRGVEINGATLRTRDGLLSISGTGGGTDSDNQGVLLNGAPGCDCTQTPEIDYAVVESTGAGAIHILGKAVAAKVDGLDVFNGDNNGVAIARYSGVRSSGGAITIEGLREGADNANSAAVAINGFVHANAAHGNGLVSVSGVGSAPGYGIAIYASGAIVSSNRDVTLTSEAAQGGVYVAGSVQANNLTVNGPLAVGVNFLSEVGTDAVLHARGLADFDAIRAINGGNLQVVAGSIAAGNIDTLQSADGSASYGSSGSIKLAANAGSIATANLRTGFTNPTSNFDTAGSITLKALDHVTTGAIDTGVVDTGSVGAGDAGAVSIIAQRGAIATQGVNTQSANNNFQSGRGGKVFMGAGTSVTVGAINTSSLAVGSSGGASTADGGSVTLYANGGNVNTGNIDTGSRHATSSTDSLAGNGGAVMLRAWDDVQVSGNISTAVVNSGGALSGTGGEVSLYALGGAISFTGIDATSSSDAGGNVTLFTAGVAPVSSAVTTSGVITIIDKDVEYVGLAPNGDYIVNATANVELPDLSETSARNVILSAGGSVTSNGVITPTGTATDAGWVSMRAGNGSVTVGGDITTQGGDILLRANGDAGDVLGVGNLNAQGSGSFINGGTVRVAADRDVGDPTTGYAGNMIASAYNLGQSADGGTVLIQSSLGSVNLSGSLIDASGAGVGGTGGQIEITANSGSISLGLDPLKSLDIIANSFSPRFIAGEVSSFSTSQNSSGGKGGSVRISTALASAGGSITQTSGTISALGGSATGSVTAGIMGGMGGDGGSILVEAGTGGSVTLGVLAASGGDGGQGYFDQLRAIPYASRSGDGGKGGVISITAPGAISVSSIEAFGGFSKEGSPNGNGGDGGTMELQSTGAGVSVLGAIRAAGGSASGSCTPCDGWGGDGGKGGQVDLIANAVSVIVDGLIDVSGGDGFNGGSASGRAEPTRGGNGGKGGTVSVTAQRDALLNLVVSSGGIGGDGLFDSLSGNYTTLSGDGGTGGPVSLTAVDGTLTLFADIYADGGDGGLGSTGGHGGDAGNVTLRSGGELTGTYVGAYGGSAASDAPYRQGGVGGKGAQVHIESVNASVAIDIGIDAYGGSGASGTASGAGADVTVTANVGDILVSYVDASGYPSGDVVMTAGADIVASDIYADGYSSDLAVGGNAGSIELAAGGVITSTGFISASGGSGGTRASGQTGFTGGNGGMVTLIAQGVVPNATNISSVYSNGGIGGYGQTFNGAYGIGGDIAITTSHDITSTLGAYISSGGGNITLDAGGDLTLVDFDGAGIYSNGGNVTLKSSGGGAITVGSVITTNSLASGSAGDIRMQTAGSITVNGFFGINANSNADGGVGGKIRLLAGGDLTVATGLSTDAAGDAVILSSASGVFDSSLGTISSPNGRWLVYLADPTKYAANSNLAYDFKQYGNTLDTSTMLPAVAGTESENGLIYEAAPTLTANLTGTVTKTYDGGLDIGLEGLVVDVANVSGLQIDEVVVSGNIELPATGSLDDINAGEGKLVTAPLTELSSTDVCSTVGELCVPVYGYSLIASGNVGIIIQRPITVTAADKSKVYGDTDPALTYAVTTGNLVGSDSLTGALTRTAGENVNSYAIDASALANGNYLITKQNGTLTISQRPITFTSLTAANKVYDGNTSASITGTEFDNLVAGETLGFSGSGTFADRNVGDDKVVSVADVTKLTRTDGTGLWSNYNLISTSNDPTARANITQAALATWKGSTSGFWSDVNNWDALPDRNNVLAVSIPIGTVVTFDGGVANTTLQTLSSLGTLEVTDGNLAIANALNSFAFRQSGGTVSGAGSFTVTNSFSQSAGGIAMGGAVSVVQASGNLAVNGGISGASIALDAPTGAISQTAALSTAGLLKVRAANGASLTNSANAISAFAATTTGTGDIDLTNKANLDVQGVTVANGRLTIDNTGAMVTSGAIVVKGGDLLLTTRSPLTIGNTVNADGSITLAALTADNTSNIVINGAMASASGGISVQAYNNFVQNAGLSAALAIDVAAGGVVTFGPSAISLGNPVSYQVNGAPYLPPWIASTLSGGATDFVVAFLDQFQAVLDEQQLAVVDDPFGAQQRKNEGVVVEGEICKP